MFKKIINIYSAEYLSQLSKAELIQIILQQQSNK
jgi:hypothetical protein